MSKKEESPKSVERAFSDVRGFAYKKGNVTLSFKLSMDNDSEARDFLELLYAAENDLKKIVRNEGGDVVDNK